MGPIYNIRIFLKQDKREWTLRHIESIPEASKRCLTLHNHFLLFLSKKRYELITTKSEQFFMVNDSAFTTVYLN